MLQFACLLYCLGNSAIQVNSKPLFAYLTPDEHDTVAAKYESHSINNKELRDYFDGGYWLSHEEFDLYVSNKVLPKEFVEEYSQLLVDLSESAESGTIPPGKLTDRAIEILRESITLKDVKIPTDKPCVRIELSFYLRMGDPAIKPSFVPFAESPANMGEAIVSKFDPKVPEELAEIKKQIGKPNRHTSIAVQPYTIFDPNKMTVQDRTKMYSQISQVFSNECESFSIAVARLNQSFENIQESLVNRLLPELKGKDLSNIAFDELPNSLRDAIKLTLVSQFGGDRNDPRFLAYLSSNPKMNLTPVPELSWFYKDENGVSKGFGKTFWDWFKIGQN